MYMYNLDLNVTESSSVHGQAGGPIAPIGTEEISRNSYTFRLRPSGSNVARKFFPLVEWRMAAWREKRKLDWPCVVS